MLNIGWDKEESTEMEAKYFVYQGAFDFLGGYNVIIYKGTYAQCLCIVGSHQLNPEMTIKEIRSKTNGFV